MTGIYGLLNVSDSDTVFLSTLGQDVVYSAVNEYVARIERDLDAAKVVFVEQETENCKERYKLPGGGRMQRRGRQSQAGAVKAIGQWDVAYPLEDFGDQIAGDDVALAYMTAQDLDLHLSTIQTRYVNTYRYEMLRRLFNNTAFTFEDERWGQLTIQPLASGDSVTYPPVLGSESEATDNHYLESGYAASAISNTNNPLVTLVNELEEHFGSATGGENIVTFIHQDEQPEIEALANFVEVQDRFIRTGDNVDIPINLPSVPGKIIGRGYGTWVSVWRWIPSGYMLSEHLEVVAPLKERHDPAVTGLLRGLQLVARDGRYPLESAHWRARFGIGVGNRLNGAVMELGTGGSYTIPSAYA